MASEQKPPINAFDMFEFPDNFHAEYVNHHLIGYDSRNFIITFGLHHPPNKKIKTICQILLSEKHLLELEINIKGQLARLHQNPPPAEPPPPEGSRF